MSATPENKQASLADTYDQVRASLGSSLGSYQVLSFWFANHLESTSQKLALQHQNLSQSVAVYFEKHPEAADAYTNDVEEGKPLQEKKYEAIKPQLMALSACTHLQDVLAKHLPELQQFEEHIQGMRLDLSPDITPNSSLANHIRENMALLEEHQQCITSFLAYIQTYPTSLPLAHPFIKQAETFSLSLLQYELDNAHYYGRLREFNGSATALEHKRVDTVNDIERFRELSIDTMTTSIALEAAIKKAFLQEEHASEDELNAENGEYMADNFEHVKQMLNYMETRAQQASTKEELNFVTKTLAALARNNRLANELTWEQLQGNEKNPGIIPQLFEHGNNRDNPYIDELLDLARSNGPIKTLMHDGKLFCDELTAKQRQTQI